MDTKIIKEIAEDLGLQGILSSLKALAKKDDSSLCSVVIPLVGEFSAGKTTLINSLTNTRQLETATKPTTATIYEISFGNESSYAEVFDSEGAFERRVDDIKSLKNSELHNASLVKVFDTSHKVSSSIVIVDTPGLSAPDPKHRQALVDYLPNSDGILLVSDINQQLTASLLGFIKTAKLANRTIFLALTQCDTKADSEIESARRYASSVSGIPIDNIVCVSAYKEQLEELYKLLNRIQTDKSNILKKVNEHRFCELKNQVIEILDQLIKSSEPNTSFDDVVREQKYKYNTLKQEIEGLVETVQNEIESISRDSARKFEDQIFDQLDSLAATDGIDYDAEAKALVDSTMRVMFNDYRTSIQTLFARKARESFSSDDSIALSGLMGIDLSGFDIGEMPYNLNLNELGHEYDKKITAGIKIAAAVAVTAAIVSTGGAAEAARSATKNVAGAANAGKVAKVASTLVSFKKGVDFISNTSDKYGEIEEKNRAHNERGALESLIGTITDRTLGKPQRRRAIHQYVDLTLSPSYKQGLESITSLIITAFSDCVQNCAASQLNEITEALQKAKKEQFDSESAYKERIHKLAAYRKKLLNS
ncbi:MAG: dynamin family protein [Bacteroidales bacterium]|nr:dynamin family protein [Bacteroidales bacterium]